MLMANYDSLSSGTESLSSCLVLADLLLNRLCTSKVVGLTVLAMVLLSLDRLACLFTRLEGRGIAI